MSIDLCSHRGILNIRPIDYIRDISPAATLNSRKLRRFLESKHKALGCVGELHQFAHGWKELPDESSSNAVGWHADYSSSDIGEDGRPAQYTNRVGLSDGKGFILHFCVSQIWYETNENGKSVRRCHLIGSCSFEIPDGFHTYVFSNKGAKQEPVGKLRLGDGSFRFLVLEHMTSTLPSVEAPAVALILAPSLPSALSTRFVVLSDYRFDSRLKADQHYARLKTGNLVSYDRLWLHISSDHATFSHRELETRVKSFCAFSAISCSCGNYATCHDKTQGNNVCLDCTMKHSNLHGSDGNPN